jgi:hypothetical protein
MYGKIISATYILTILFQSLLSLIFPIAIALGASYLLVEYASVGGWIYAVLTVPGAILGVISMCRFIIASMRALDALEKQRKDGE